MLLFRFNSSGSLCTDFVEDLRVFLGLVGEHAEGSVKSKPLEFSEAVGAACVAEGRLLGILLGHKHFSIGFDLFSPSQS